MKGFLLAASVVVASAGVFSSASPADHGPNHGICTDPTIRVEQGDNITFGTPGDDVIKGGQGPDVIHGRGGDDKICGNLGTDRIIGDGGDDKLSGGHSNDRLIGENGFDLASGHGGSQDYCRAERKKKCEL